MQQYLELLTAIKERGTYKPAAREGMPGTQSLFGYQFRHDLSKGFPLLTTKKMFWKGVVVELLWFLQGDTNIKYLVDNGVNIWNEDAYNYYLKKHYSIIPDRNAFNFSEFIEIVKTGVLIPASQKMQAANYKYGDCGFQYGKVWRRWRSPSIGENGEYVKGKVDQIKNVIDSLRKSPEGRRHIITAWDPAHDHDLALTWCHALFQFNCRPIDIEKRIAACSDHDKLVIKILDKSDVEGFLDKVLKVPKYYLDCQLYQRSADVFLGVPFNIASYALLTHIIAEMCNMIPGEFIHTFGDVHIYDNHRSQVEEQLSRTPNELPALDLLDLNEVTWNTLGDDLRFDKLSIVNFKLDDYNPQESIKAELSTGLKK